MGLSPRSKTTLFATILIAALACLQAGIDPVFLTLLSSAHPVAPADHGWIVGATQAGMAVGAVIVWRLGARLSRAVFTLAAIATFLSSLATAQIEETPALLAIRAGYGLAMGMIYTRAMSAAAAAVLAFAHSSISATASITTSTACGLFSTKLFAPR